MIDRPQRPLREAAQLLAVLGLSTGLLSACSLAPTYQRPALATSQQWPDAERTASAAGPAAAPKAADIGWSAFFKDESLRQLIEIALEHNRDLRVAVLNIEQARAQWQIRRADQWPGVGLSASGSRTPNTSGSTTSVYSVGLMMSAFELDVFGRIASLKDQALAQYLATEEARKAVHIGLVSAVANAWMTLLADQDVLTLARQTLATREESLRLVQLRFEHGAASELDLRQAQSLTESARAAVAQSQRLRLQDENALTLLLGQEMPAATRAQLSALTLSTLQLPNVPAGLPSDLLERRPDIRQAEQLLVAANANIGAARAAFFPRITLTTGLGTVSNQLSGLFQSGSWGFTLSPQATLPLFDAGRNQAGLESALAGRDIAVAQYEKAVQSAFREVADALAGQATLQEQVQALQAQAEADRKRLELSDLRYRNGVSSHLELLDAQRSLFATQQSMVQTQLARLLNQVAVYKALGGGWLRDAAP